MDWPRWPLRGDPESDPGDPSLIASLMWSDAACSAPRRNAAQVLDSITQTREAAQASEFLDIHQRFAAGPPAAVDAVWAEPRAYHWTRVGHRLLDAEAQGDVGRHLDQFKAFALGLALRTNSDWTFASPLTVELPFAVPGSRLSLDGSGPAEIAGVVDGELNVVTKDAVLYECPVAVQNEYRLKIHPHAFNVPAFEITEPPLKAGLEYHEQQVELVNKTLASVHRYAPQTYADFSTTIRMAALKPREWGGFDDFSEPELPGSFVASVIANPMEMGDHFIHEFQHNRLSCIEESGPLFEEAGNTASAPNYYSPFRNKPRGLYGLFHGVYVFVAVHDYWLKIFETEAVEGRAMDYVTDRVIRIPLQLELGVSVLKRHANLTTLGRTILDELDKHVARIHEEGERAGVPNDAPAVKVGGEGDYSAETGEGSDRPLSVRDAVLEHVKNHDVNHQVADVLQPL
jgi:hypothetical protein